MIEEKQLVVSIRCLTYNHEPYIRQCLEGFVMQKTNFKFEAIVHDDASTDGTAAIIREYAEKYPDIIKPIYETENQYSKHDDSLGKIMNAHMRGKYIAMCEGDDYWIDPLKLQKQVDFLEANTEYGLVHTDRVRWNEKEKKFQVQPKKTCNDGWVFEALLLHKFYISTLTVLFRSSLLNTNDTLYDGHKFMMGDYPMWLEMSRKCKFKYLPEKTACYRILEKSASHNPEIEYQLRFLKSIFDVRFYFMGKYNVPLKIKKKIQNDYICEMFNLYYQNKVYKKAVELYRQNHNWFGVKIFIKYCIAYLRRNLI